MYAIFQTGGKQYRVSEGDVITVEKIEANEGDVVTFDQVLTVVNDADVKVGTPVVEGAKITAKVEKQDKAKKSFSNTKLNPTIVVVRVIVSRSLN